MAELPATGIPANASYFQVDLYYPIYPKKSGPLVSPLIDIGGQRWDYGGKMPWICGRMVGVKGDTRFSLLITHSTN